MSVSENVIEPTRATARLPGLDIEIIHRRSPNGDAEQISIHLQALPSFEAFGRLIESANPFAFWAKAVQIVWLPWLAVAGAVLPHSRPLLAAEAKAKAAEDARRAAEAKAAEDARQAAKAKAADDARRAAKAIAAKQTGSVVKTTAAEEARGVTDAKVPKNARRVAEAKETGSIGKGKAAEVARSGVKKVAEEAPRATDTKVPVDARRVAKAKTAKETGNFVKPKAGKLARGSSKGH